MEQALFQALSLLSFLLPLSSASLVAQQFGGQEEITTSALGAESVYATDLDGDGDADVLSASVFDDKIAWYENLGNGSFHSGRDITTSADSARSVYATDLDGDGDADVLSASYLDGKIAWYENLGNGTFGAQLVIDTANNPWSVYAADLDNDGDVDVLSASYSGNKISWYENLGGGAFSGGSVISAAVGQPMSVYATDLDGDGDADVLSASEVDDKIAWYENLGNGTFSGQLVITTDANNACSVYAKDLDGDGDTDVLSASYFDGKIAWYENLGNGTFSGQLVVAVAINAWSVYAADLDGDGDADVLSASQGDDKIAWYENLGSGSFHSGRTITDSADNARSVYATDLDGDGDADVLSASVGDNKIAWYENLLDPDTDQDGLSDFAESTLGTDPFDQDSDDDGLSDGEEVNTSRPDTRWLAGPNGHYYRLAPAATWSQASAAARAQGYELTSVQDEAEAIWLSDTFGDVGDGFWIGLNDFSGTFEWSDGDLSSYRRWATGEPNTSFVAAWVGGPSSGEPGYWYADPAGATPRLAVWESPGPAAPTTALDPLAFDTDGDGLGDGQEDGVDAIIWDGGGIPGVTGTDPLVFIPDADPLTTTDPLDLDSDEDGIEDGDEDLDGDGATSPGETDAALADTDGDGLPDGLELGLTAGTLDTNGGTFIPDADPLTTTDPLLADTDGGGVPDGVEDQSADGAVDTWETDPNLAADEALAFYVSQFESNKTVLFEVFNATPRVLLVPLYSRLGPGPTATTLGVTLDLSMPITALRTTLADAQGYAAWSGPNLPTLPPGITVFWQAVEIPFSPILPPRASNPIELSAGAN